MRTSGVPTVKELAITQCQVKIPDGAEHYTRMKMIVGERVETGSQGRLRA
jgi:hypothetical protein